jgi:hypothetical protein
VSGEEATRPLTRRDIEARIVALAWQDEDFRHAFVSDPKRQFEERLGVKLPESLRMTVHEESETSLHFVIPAKPASDLDELSDEDLEKVAGGTDVTVVFTIIGSIMGATVLTAVVGAPVAEATGWGL